MSHRIVWPVVAALSLAGVIAWLSQSSAQRAPGGRAGGAGEPGMAGPHGMPGRFVVVNAQLLSRGEARVLLLDTMTGQLYRAEEKDVKKMSEMPGRGQPGGRDGRPPVRDLRPEPKLDKDGRQRDRRPEKDAPRNDEDAGRPDRRTPVKDAKERDDVRPTPKDQAPPRREEK
jgi:hypothetical protein